jgi:hypothetical protein
LVFDVIGVDRYAGYRTDLHTLRFIEVSYALGALVGINFVDLLAKIDGLVGTLWLAHITVNALIGNDQRHGWHLMEVSEKFKQDVMGHIIDARKHRG